MGILQKDSAPRRQLRKLAHGGVSLANVGRRRYCCVCDRGARRFLNQGERLEVRCPHCESLEHQRAAWLFIKERSGLLQARGEHVLHLSAEPSLERRLRRAIGAHYVTADPLNPRADVRLDICDNPFRNEWFDFVICGSGLAQASDDGKAMREIRRVLKPGGRALIVVPFLSEADELAASLGRALLQVEVFHPEDLCPSEQSEAMVLGDTALFWCQRSP